MSFSGAYRRAMKICYRAATNDGRSAPAQRGFAGCLAGLRVTRTQACGRVIYIFGTKVQDIGRLIKQHKQMQKMMKKFSAKGGMAKMMRGMGSMMPGGGICAV